jgi:squalene-hopene/tetraprenyl-beta-curcumene cyclase
MRQCRSRSAVVLSLVLVLLSTATRRQARGGEPPAWQAKAARYLDGRAKELKAWRSALQSDGTACITCHTGLPYLLSRPRLRRASGDDAPTELEGRLLQDIGKRVQNWKNVVPWYRSSPEQRKQSLGTEAIVNALALAHDDAELGKKQIRDLTAQAFRNLWREQHKEGEQKGAWSWLDFGLEPWESKGAAYYGTALAAVAVGTAPGDYARKAGQQTNVRMMHAYLTKHCAKQNLHNRILLLWAAAKWPNLLPPEQQKKLMATILDKQRPDGGWSLSSLGKWPVPEAASDGYATGLIVFVLRQAGLQPDQKQLRKGVRWLVKNQTPELGSWPARSVNKKAADQSPMVRQFMTDAATAYAVLALTMSR